MALPNYFDLSGCVNVPERNENNQNNYLEQNQQVNETNTNGISPSYLYGLYGLPEFQQQTLSSLTWKPMPPSPTEPPEKKAAEETITESAMDTPFISKERSMIMQLRDEVTSELNKFRELALAWHKERATLKASQRELSKQLTLAQDEVTRLRREVAMLRVEELNWHRVGAELRNTQFQLSEAAVKLKGKEQEIAGLSHELRTLQPRLIRLRTTERTVKKLEEEVQRLRPLERELKLKQQQIEQLQKEKTQIKYLRRELDACQRFCEEICIAAAKAKEAETAPAGVKASNNEAACLPTECQPIRNAGTAEINYNIRRATL